MFKTSVYFIISLFCLEISADVIVETTHGRVSGKILNTLIKNTQYYGFMGIPYAAPPVKELRFKPPQNINPWTKVLSTKKEKPACVQFNTNLLKGQRLGQYGVEDCLYLDIYTPTADRNKRSVITLLYNERFQNSYNKSKDYGPDFFIEEDVIVVTISHRLSAFGFLSLEDDNVPGNAGLRDIVAALEWVSENIEHFGGDPHRITLLGSQGGAVAVDLLLHTKARKMINSAILQSGTSLSSMYLQDKVAERAFELGELLNISTTSKEYLLKELSKVSASNILSNEIRAAPKEFFKENQRGVLTFGPVVENNNSEGLLTVYPEDSLHKTNIPVMIGVTSREGLSTSLNYLTTPTNLRYFNKDFPLLMPIRLKYKFDPEEDGYYDAVEDIRKFYFSKDKITESSISSYITYIGDVMTSYAVDKMADMYSNSSSVYYYRFSYYSDLNENKNNILKISTVEEGTWGAAAGDELCYVFKCPRLKDKYLRHERVDSDVLLVQRKMIKMFANFVKFGNPTPDDDNPLSSKWPAYSASSREYLSIDSTIEVKNNSPNERFQFWDRFIKTWASRAERGVVKKRRNDEL